MVWITRLPYVLFDSFGFPVRPVLAGIQYARFLVYVPRSLVRGTTLLDDRLPCGLHGDCSLVSYVWSPTATIGTVLGRFRQRHGLYCSSTSSEIAGW